MEDLSDRELERYLADSTAGKWFCDFALTETTPDYSVFSKMFKTFAISNICSGNCNLINHP
nr:transposase [Rickettsia asembonensis]